MPFGRSTLHWVRQWWTRCLGAHPEQMRRRQRPAAFRPRLDHLEDRLAPATVQFSAGSETVNVSAGTFTVPVTLAGTPTPTVSTFASGLNSPEGLAFDSAGNLYVANIIASTVSKVTPGGVVSPFASGVPNAFGLAFDTVGNLFVADFNALGGIISKVTPAAVVSTFASGFSFALTGGPTGLAFDAAGNLFVSDSNDNTVSKVTPGGVVSPFASGFSAPSGLAFDAAGNLFVSNLGTGTVSKVTPGGVVSTFVSGLSAPEGLAFDAAGNLFVANLISGTVSEVTPAAVASTFVSGFSTGVPAGPIGLAIDANGNLYVADNEDNVVSEVTDTVSAPFSLGGTAVPGTDFSGVTASPLTFGTGQTTKNITGTLLADPGTSNAVTFTLGPPTNATLGSITVNTLTINEPSPLPTVASISPTSATTGSSLTTITLTGAGFVNGSTADFNGAPLTTTFVSATELIAVIPATDLTTVGTDTITVVTSGPGGGTSAPQTFTVNNVTPTLTKLSPASATAGSPNTSITLTGTGFVNGSTADFSGTPLATTFVSATQLTAVIPSAALTTAFIYPITVVTAAPGGGTSAPQTFAVNPAVPSLSVTKTDSGNFFRGEISAAFTITVTNRGAGPTSGTINLADGLPGGLSATAFVGTGWTVDLAHFTATRSDPLAAGASYPPLTLTVNVDINAPNNLINFVTVSGGAANSASASDPLTIGVPPLVIATTHGGTFFRGETGATFTITVGNSGPTPLTGTTTVVDALPGGLTATAFAGTGWSVNLATFTATRTDPLAGDASYPPLILTVNVDTNAQNSLTNFTSLSGVGVTNLGTSSDTATIGSPTLAVSKTHAGTFTKGEIGAIFTITVTNTGVAPTTGTLSLSDGLPGAFTMTSFAGAGWTINGFTATRAMALASGQSSVLTMKVNVSAKASGKFTNTVTLLNNGLTFTVRDSVQL